MPKLSKTYNLTVLYPDLVEEWNYTKNNKLKPEERYPKSHRKVWWTCKKCGYEWKASISSRSVGRGCPACAGKAVSVKNSLFALFPVISNEWHKVKNGNLTPCDVTHGSEKRVWWKCSICGYSWISTIYNRTNGKGCPACAGQVVTDKNKLSVVRPDLAAEFDKDKNKVVILNNLSEYSNKKVWWVCSKCNYKWKASISGRSMGRGCPACAGKAVTINNCLAINFPEIAKEWHPTKNGKVTPNDVTYGTKKKFWWRCQKCYYEWEKSVTGRTHLGRGCPQCAKGFSVSKISQKWLDSLNIPKEYREYTIETVNHTYKVDGFSPKTNTVYEFLGDYWHGNPKKFDLNDTNETIKKTFGELYKNTLDRFKNLEKAGYNICYIWESDFNV